MTTFLLQLFLLKAINLLLVSVQLYTGVGLSGAYGDDAALEEAFDIVFEMDDIIDFSSYEVGKELLKSMILKFNENI